MKSYISVFKNLSFFILISIFFADCFTYSQTASQMELLGFRGSNWGSSIDKVKATETESYLQSFHGFGIDALSYKGDIAGLTARIDYSFKDDRLFEGTYIITPDENIKTYFNKFNFFFN